MTAIFHPYNVSDRNVVFVISMIDWLFLFCQWIFVIWLMNSFHAYFKIFLFRLYVSLPLSSYCLSVCPIYRWKNRVMYVHSAVKYMRDFHTQVSLSKSEEPYGKCVDGNDFYRIYGVRYTVTVSIEIIISLFKGF